MMIARHPLVILAISPAIIMAACHPKQDKTLTEPEQRPLHQKLIDHLNKNGILVFVNNDYLFGNLENVEMGNDTSLYILKNGSGMSWRRMRIEWSIPSFNPDLSKSGDCIKGEIHDGFLFIEGKKVTVYRDEKALWIKPCFDHTVKRPITGRELY